MKLITRLTVGQLPGVFLACSAFMPTLTSYGSELLTWEDALARAAQSSAELSAANAELRAVEYQEPVARSGFFPSVSANLGYDRSDGRVIAGTGGTVGGSAHSTTLSGTQNLYAGGADAARSERAQANTRVAQANVQAVKAKLSRELKSAFQSLVYAQASEELTQEIVRRREENLRLVELRFKGGRENKGSVLLSQANLEQARYDGLQARNASRVARAQLATVLRANATPDYRIAGPGVPVQAPPAMPPDFAQLAAATPEAAQAQGRYDAAVADVSITRAPLFPSVSLNGTVGRYGDDFSPEDEQRWSVGVNLSVPIFNGGRDYYGTKSAQATKYAAGETRANTILQASTRLEQAYAAYLEAVAKLNLDESFRRAALVRAEIARQKYNNGLLSFEDWDIIENDLIGRQKVYLQSQRDRVIAEAVWEQAQGRGSIP